MAQTDCRGGGGLDRAGKHPLHTGAAEACGRQDWRDGIQHLCQRPPMEEGGKPAAGIGLRARTQADEPHRHCRALILPVERAHRARGGEGDCHQVGIRRGKPHARTATT